MSSSVAKKWKPELLPVFQHIREQLAGQSVVSAVDLEADVKAVMQEKGLKPGDLLPLLRIALAGTMKGPAVFDMAALLGGEETALRLQKFEDRFAH